MEITIDTILKNSKKIEISPLGFSDSKHFCAAGRTNAFSSWFSIFQSYRLGLKHIPFGSAFYTVSGCHRLNTVWSGISGIL